VVQSGIAHRIRPQRGDHIKFESCIESAERTTLTSKGDIQQASLKKTYATLVQILEPTTRTTFFENAFFEPQFRYIYF